MDPVSIGASIVGLVAFASKAVPFLREAHLSITGAPKFVGELVTELLAVTSVLESLQPYILENLKISPDRASLIQLESLITVLTECVSTYSELERLLAGLAGQQKLGAVDRMKWAIKEHAIQPVLVRLQGHKSSLTLILNIIQCQTMQEAQVQMHNLTQLVQKTLAANELLATRMHEMERMRSVRSRFSVPGRPSRRQQQVFTAAESDFDPLSSNSTTSSESSLSTTLEEDIQGSRVYSRLRKRDTVLSIFTSKKTVVSTYTQLSVADVADIASLDLPIRFADIYNEKWYRLHQETPVRPSAHSGTLSPSPPSTQHRIVRSLSALGERRPSSPSSFLLLSSPTPEERANTEIKKAIKADKKKKASEVKAVMLGSSEKSITRIFKKIKARSAGSWSEQERKEYRVLLFDFLLQTFQDAVMAMESTSMEFEIKANAGRAQAILAHWSIGPDEPLPPEYLEAFEMLWEDRMLQKALLKTNSVALPPGFVYWILALERLFAKTYMPTDEDILRLDCQYPTVAEAVFPLPLAKHTCRLINVAEQQSSQKKWIHSVDDAAAIVFVSDMSTYDEPCKEDPSIDGLGESLKLFRAVIKDKSFYNAQIILLFDNADHFRTKVSESTIIKRWYPDYKGDPHNTNVAVDFVVGMFEEAFTKRSGSRSRTTRSLKKHLVNSTDTDILERLSRSIARHILPIALSEYGLI